MIALEAATKTTPLPQKANHENLGQTMISAFINLQMLTFYKFLFEIHGILCLFASEK
jgi:hypothetical protein